MSEPQIIRTPSGEELVVLPRAEYEALLERADHEAEDAADVTIYDARKAEFAAGGVVLPPEVSAALLRGESRLRVIRSWRDETQLHLNFITNISQGCR
jgi:MoxR-like ATPase